MKKLRSLLIALILTLGLGMFLLPVFADNDVHVDDETGLISDYQLEQLDAYAQRISDVHNTGVYIRFIDTYRGFANNVTDASEYVFKNEDLGISGDGILLLVAMSEGEYDLCAHGNTANTAFTDYAKSKMARRIEYFLSSSDWYTACSEFLSQSDTMLTYLESHGEPFDTNNDPAYQQNKKEQEAAARSMKIGATFGLPPIAALLTCLGLKARNKNTGIRTEAHNYFARNGININRVQDLFINRTEMHTPLPRSSSSGGGGGTTINSGGFSHHSGSFRH